MANNVYIGMRYVPKFMGAWDSTLSYEALCIVQYGNNSYTSKRPVPVGTLPTDTDYWALTGNYNGAILELQNDIASINSDITGIQGDITDIEDDITSIKLINKGLHGNLLLNDVFLYSDGSPNGSCYIGNDRVVSYFSKDSSSNTGTLKCYNLSTYSVMWSYAIKGYHGNSITYNPDNNHIYICGCLDNTDSSRINVIVEVDLASPSAVLREITLPDITECYSLAYDIETKKFYAVPYIGTIAGVADLVYIYDSTLTTKEGIVQLKNHPSVQYSLSTQGIPLVKDGIAYLLSYAQKCRAIYSYNITTGDLISVAMLPLFINKCRGVGEPQSIIYNYDTDSFLVGSIFMTTGAASYWVHNIFEVDMFKGIEELEPLPDHTVYGINDNNTLAEFWCVVAGDTLKPGWIINNNLLTLPNDGCIYASLTNRAVNIKMKRSLYNVNSQNYRLANLQLSNFSGRIQGEADNDRIPIAVCNIGTYSHANFLYCEFESHETGASNTYANLFVDSGSHIFLQNCTLGPVSGGDPADRYHVVAIKFSEVYGYSCTLSGTVQADKLATLGSEVTFA